METQLWAALNPRLESVPASYWRAKAERRGYRFDATGRLLLPHRRQLAFDFPVMIVGLPYHPNYFHWLFEAVGRYLAIRDFVPADVRLAVNRLKQPFQLELLQAAGVPQEALVELPSSRLVEFPVVYVPPRATNHPHLSPAVVAALRSLRKPGSVAYRRLYVSRRDANTRRVLNDDEVRATLERYGFETVEATTLTIRDQIDLFSEAEVVVGAHGAGLANAVYCPEHTLLVELLPTGYDTLRTVVFWTLAALANLKYARVDCPAAAGKRFLADFSVDCRLLARALERCLPTLGSAPRRGAAPGG